MIPAVWNALRNGDRLYAARRYDLALDQAHAALAVDPEEPAAHALAGWCHSALHRPAEAERAAREAVRCAPDARIGWECLAQVLATRGAFVESLDACDRALVLEPDRPALHVIRAHALSHLTRPVEALNALASALELDPEMVEAHTERARILEEHHHDEHVLATAQTVLRLEAENAEGHALHGWLRLRRGDLDGAERDLLESLRLEPDGERALDGLIVVRKLRHPLLRHWAPGWRGAKPTQREQDPGHEARFLRAWNRLGGVLTLPALFAMKPVLAGWSPWVAWPCAALAGLVLGFVGALVLLFLWAFGQALVRETAVVALRMLHSAFVETLGDLVLCATRAGRRLLPAWRIRFALLMWGTPLAAASVGWWWSTRQGSWQGPRTALAALLCASILVRLPGDLRRFQLALLPSVALLALGLHLAAWGVAGAGILHAFAYVLWTASCDPKATRGANLVAALGAVPVALALATWLTGAPEPWWAPAVAAATTVGVIVVVCARPVAPATPRAEDLPGAPGRDAGAPRDSSAAA